MSGTLKVNFVSVSNFQYEASPVTVLCCGYVMRCDCFRERQQQLDELTKELGRAQEDGDLLRIKIRSIQKASKTGTTVSLLALSHNYSSFSSYRLLLLLQLFLSSGVTGIVLNIILTLYSVQYILLL